MLDELVQQTEGRMKTAVEAIRRELATIRTGRANPALLEKVTVDYYGSQVPVNQVGTITVPESRLMVISPWDKSMIPEIVKAITRSELGINPGTDGNVIRLPLPSLTEERRRELVKQVSRRIEEGKIEVRNIRRDAIEHLRSQEKQHQISEDDMRRTHERIQKLTDKYVEEFDQLRAAKEEEIMEV